MTQKELLYLEDAIGHEENIIKICEDISKNLEDHNLVTYMENELNTHKTLRDNLINMLEVKANE